MKCMFLVVARFLSSGKASSRYNVKGLYFDGIILLLLLAPLPGQLSNQIIEDLIVFTDLPI